MLNSHRLAAEEVSYLRISHPLVGSHYLKCAATSLNYCVNTASGMSWGTGLSNIDANEVGLRRLHRHGPEMPLGFGNILDTLKATFMELQAFS